MSSRKFIETELKENPEFFRAFPHLQKVFDNEDDVEEKEHVFGERKY